MKNKILCEDTAAVISHIDADLCRRKTFLVTGATGSIASMIVYTLLELNDQLGGERSKVLALCRDKDKAEKYYQDYLGREDLIFLFQDVTEPVIYDGRIDYIIHAAGNSVTKRFMEKPVDTMTANLIGTYRMLELGREKNIQSMLFLSSGSIYGDACQAETDIREDEYFPIDPLEVRSCYSLSKKTAENICVCYAKQYDMKAKMIRIAHTYGPMIDLKDGHVYSDFIAAVLHRTPLVIKGDGSDKRPFCYVTDTVAAIFLILFYGENGQAYNMANNDCHISIGELADKLVKDVFPERCLEVCYPNGRKATVEQGEVSLNTGKLEKLGWAPAIGIEEGFRRVIEYYES